MPEWLKGHLRRCPGHPWVNDLPDEAVVPAPLAGVLLSVLPASVVENATRPTVTRSRQDRLALDFRYGYRIRSPIEGVRARQWLRVVTAALEEKGLASIQDTLSLEGFRALEGELVRPGVEVSCPDCGESLSERGLERHRATNAACQWRRAAFEARELWSSGWRDPYSVDGAPPTWAELMGKIRWKRRLATVDFPAGRRSCSSRNRATPLARAHALARVGGRIMTSRCSDSSVRARRRVRRAGSVGTCPKTASSALPGCSDSTTPAAPR